MLYRLEKFISENGAKHWSFAARKDKEFLAWVYENTKDLPETTEFATRVYCAVNNTRPICELGGVRKLKSIMDGWKFCGKTGNCQCAAESVSKNLKKTLDEKGEDWRKERFAKAKETLLEKTGVNNPGQTLNAKQKHSDFYANSALVEQAVKKSKNTMMVLYGVDNALKLPNINRKEISRIRSNISSETAIVLDDPKKLSELLQTNSTLSISKLLNVDVSTINNYVLKYDIRTEYGSSFEGEIAHFLKSNDLEFVSRSRSIIAPYEIDFFIPKFNLGIEFNGLYYHSSAVIIDDKHHKKFVLSQNNGIRLLMVNEDEWVERADIIKSKILNLCNKSIRGVGARELKVSRINTKDAAAFIDKHHIQGRPGPCSDAFGATLNGELVAAITLSPQRGTNSIEMNRFCTDGRVFAGVFSKLVAEMRKSISKPIITFADLRYSDGGLYKKCGFVEEYTIKPDYKYVKRNKTYHKSLFTKSKIQKKFNVDMSKKTEREAMEELGYSRIYDCGKIKFVLK